MQQDDLPLTPTCIVSHYQTTTVTAGTEGSNVTQLQENPSYRPVTVVSSGTDASIVMLSQENFSYILAIFQPAPTDET